MDSIIARVAEACERLESADRKKALVEAQLSALNTPEGLRRHRKEIEESRELCRTAAHALACRHLATVVPIAWRYVRPGLALLDLIQEGNAGLLQAVDRYDQGRGPTFRQFSRDWIRKAISRFITDHARLIRGSDRDPVSLDEPLHDDDSVMPGDMIVDPNTPVPYSGLEQESLRSRLGQLLRRLTVRERNVLRLRFGLGSGRPHSTQEVARAFRVSRSRVRRIQTAAIRKLGEPWNRVLLESFLTAD